MHLDQIKNITVIGLGTMGPGLAQAFALAGFRVTGFDANPQMPAQAKKIFQANLDSLVEFGELEAEAARAAGTRLDFAESLAEAVGKADLVVETVSEKRDIKRQVYAQIAEHLPQGSLLWSNTSTLNIYDLLPEALIPRSIISHWFAPPHIIPLVEVVKDPRVEQATVDTTLALLEVLGKKAIVIEKFVPGFVINRIQRLLGYEIFFLLENGYISPEDLDLAVKASIAPRMMLLGLVQRYDFTGLELSARNLQDQEFFDPPLDHHPAPLFSRVEEGKLGVKSGEGFYDYRGRELSDILRDRDRYLMRIIKNLDFCIQKDRLV
ncbi:3-hydroxyacyl-CoA dehydrogenase family protein [Desulfoferula mesophila]|uniref:3-hydroxyacyl-CoA dehydrogenase n=1 Tax=Desulfoferula mesophila TaxID=3058419 RepID=A0AAU9EVK3_9BACT|nr:3-hydroxyacyl-CoA dehydrogenase [Desulfoferula mesophilus]